jgi:biotin carboxyl carrier protein
MNANIKNLRITLDGKSYDVTVEMLGEQAVSPAVNVLSASSMVMGSAPVMAPTSAAPAAAKPAEPKAAGAVPCPLSGTIVAVHVTEGQQVKAGDLLVTLEAMKMNTPVRALTSGTVRSLAAKQGAVFEEGATLLVLE